MATEKSTLKEMGKGMSSHNRGHLFMQTNEIRHSVIHYHRLTNGTPPEVERAATSLTKSDLRCVRRQEQTFSSNA